jgi:pimeloyl-ACP methyl ester carboxylesterase
VRGGAPIVLRYSRDGESYERRLEPTPMPLEEHPSCEVRYAHVRSNGHRIRTITVQPSAGAPAVLFLQGIRCQSIDLALTPDAPIAQLVRGLAQSGFTVVRVEKPGVGDSEGGPCEAMDFSAELAAYDAALSAMRGAHSPIFLFGHSVGGIAAPILAERHEVRGIVAYGTSARRWTSGLKDGLVRQLALRGASEDAIAARLARFEADPFGELESGRARAFHEELDRIDVELAWDRARAPALVLIGEHDWVAGREAQLAIAARVRADVVELSGLDHAFTKHASVTASLRAYGAGAFDRRIVDESARWMKVRC